MSILSLFSGASVWNGLEALKKERERKAADFELNSERRPSSTFVFLSLSFLRILFSFAHLAPSGQRYKAALTHTDTKIKLSLRLNRVAWNSTAAAFSLRLAPLNKRTREKERKKSSTRLVSLSFSVCLQHSGGWRWNEKRLKERARRQLSQLARLPFNRVKNVLFAAEKEREKIFHLELAACKVSHSQPTNQPTHCSLLSARFFPQNFFNSRAPFVSLCVCVSV